MEKIRTLVDKALRLPSLAHIYSMEVDRALRAQGKEGFTFSALEFAECCRDRASELGFGEPLASQERPTAKNVMYQAEQLVKAGKRTDAIAHAFSNAWGPEVSSLNIFYANHATQRPELRLRYLNKYLRAHGLHINLAQGNDSTFFYRLGCDPPTNKIDGPLVTVIMPAHNAERTIDLAVGSLLNQTWKNLQIIVVDDASTDATLRKARELAKRDPRVEVLNSPVNVGPYVCRNLGVLHTRGQWLTVHDADDWAFPDRIEQQVQALTAANALACIGRMLRMNEQGQITRPIPGASGEECCYLRSCFVSLMVQTAYFRNQLGAWDSVRVGGDAEMIERLKVLGTAEKHLPHPLMLCLDQEAGLTNHHSFGLENEAGKLNPLRVEYKKAFTTWHNTKGSKCLLPAPQKRFFVVPEEMAISQEIIRQVFFHRTSLNTGDEKNFAFVEASNLPVPRPGRALLEAHAIARLGNDETALLYAQMHVPSELTYTLEGLRANAALRRKDEDSWMKHLNTYLGHFGAAPVHLGLGATLIDRFRYVPLPAVTDGPIISVIMPAWNAEKTVRAAARSILDQTWRNLELLIVDDFSTDGTWSELQRLADEDGRVKIFRNAVNVGPYVSKNIMLSMAKGIWITGHDADDWAHPQRLEQHMQALNQFVTPPRASVSYMLRLEHDGMMDRFAVQSNYSLDGLARLAAISCTYDAEFLRSKLGCWDNVRFGADSELIARCQSLIGEEFVKLPLISMLCMNLEGSLTNNFDFGVDRLTGPSEIRNIYTRAYQSWHKVLSSNQADSAYMQFPPKREARPFEAPQAAQVPLHDIQRNFALHSGLDAISNEMVTAICVSKRPHFAERVAQMMAAQNHHNLRLIYVSHGPGHDLNALNKTFACLKSVTLLELSDPDSTLGEALNMALNHVKTDLCAKIDDDDFYGPNYIRSSLIALRYSGHNNVGIVGRLCAFVYVEEGDRLALRFKLNDQNKLRNRVYGGTIFWSRGALEDQRFISKNTGEDSDFFTQATMKGVKIFSAEAYDYVHVRYAAAGAHTWNIAADDFLRTAITLTKGLRLNLAYSTASPPRTNPIPGKAPPQAKLVESPLFTARLARQRRRLKQDPKLRSVYAFLFSKPQMRQVVAGLLPKLRLPKIYCTFASIEDFDAPDCSIFVLKPLGGSHSRGVFVLQRTQTPGIFRDLTEHILLDKAEIIKRFNTQLRDSKTPITKGCLCEEYIEPIPGSSRPDDFKFYCFAGKVALVMQKSYRTSNSNDWQFKFWTDKWSDMGAVKYPNRINSNLSQPPNAIEAIVLASKLSTALPIPFCRLDFYLNEDGVFFGEVTPFPNGGRDYFDTATDTSLASLWDRTERRIRPLGLDRFLSTAAAATSFFNDSSKSKEEMDSQCARTSSRAIGGASPLPGEVQESGKARSRGLTV